MTSNNVISISYCSDCPDPAIYYKNSTSTNASTDWSSGQTVAMTCQEGYTLVGNATITCMKNSAWELKKFRCISGINIVFLVMNSNTLCTNLSSFTICRFVYLMFQVSKLLFFFYSCRMEYMIPLHFCFFLIYRMFPSLNFINVDM